MIKPVIFIVDDDEDARKVVALDLNNRYAQKYRTLQAASGSNALETLRQLRDESQPVALILSSQSLPELNGACHALSESALGNRKLTS